VLSQLLNLEKKHIIMNDEFAQLQLPNIQFNIQKSAGLDESQILSAQVSKTPLDPVDFIINSQYFQNL
jgi:predicted HTH transcriptional regulator